MLPVVPDFFLAPAPYTGPGKLKKPVSAVVMRRGTKGTAAIAVVRLGASKGGLSFSFSTLAPGVTAGISQNNASNPTAVTVVLFASYSAKPVSALVTLTAKPSAPAVGPAPRSIAIPYVVVEEYDLAVAGIDVTQGIQLPQSTTSALPARNPAKPTAAVPYPGAVNVDVVSTGTPFDYTLKGLTGAAPLVQGKKTTVDVYAVIVAPSWYGFKGATVVLHGRTKGGAALPFSPLKAANAPSLRTADPSGVPLKSVVKKLGAFRFTLPAAWTQQAWLELEAELLPPKLYGKAECSLQACLDNNRFTLTNLKLYDTGHLEVWPLAFASLKAGDPPLADPPKVFGYSARALPLAEGELRTGGAYRALYDGTTKNQKTLLATAKAFVSDLPTACASYFALFRPPSCPDLVAGVRAGGIPGVSAGGENVYAPRPGITVVNQFRPLTSVAHETGHALGFAHADTACGGGSDDQVAEFWWPDQWGLLYGITAGGKVNGAGNVGTVGSKTASSWYDFMSYCAENGSDSDSWISLVNYRRAFDGLRALQKQRSTSFLAKGAQAQQIAVLSVLGYFEGDSVVVTRARPKAGRPVVGPVDSRVRIALRDAVGRVLVEAPMRVEESRGHGPGTRYVSADLELPGTSPGALPRELYAIEIVEDGRTVGRTVRSPNAPIVELASPRAGARVGQRATVPIRWRTTDADGDALRSSVDYSTDGGRTWRVIVGDVAGEQIVVPSRLLSSSKRARLRVRVSDGLNESAALGGQFVALGSRPFVRITAPARRIAIAAGDPLSLQAEAYDDSFRPLRGRALRWFDATRPIAFGESATAAPLAPGSHRIRVVARDSSGRTASDSVVVRVRAATPRLLVRSAPSRLSPRAASIRLRLAATFPCVVSASGPGVRTTGKRRRVGARTVAVTIPVAPGRGPVRLTLRATADGQSSVLRLIVSRAGSG